MGCDMTVKNVTKKQESHNAAFIAYIECFKVPITNTLKNPCVTICGSKFVEMLRYQKLYFHSLTTRSDIKKRVLK